MRFITFAKPKLKEATDYISKELKRCHKIIKYSKRNGKIGHGYARYLYATHWEVVGMLKAFQTIGINIFPDINKKHFNELERVVSNIIADQIRSDFNYKEEEE